MKYLTIFILSLILYPLSFAQAQQREFLFGTAATPLALDTVNYSVSVGDSNISITRQVDFKGPKVGFVSLYGQVTALTGTDTSFTVYYRERGSRFDSPEIWSQYDSLGVIADGDSTFFFSVRTPSTWKISDGIEFKFVMDTTSNVGRKDIQIKAVGKFQ